MVTDYNSNNIQIILHLSINEEITGQSVKEAKQCNPKQEPTDCSGIACEMPA